MEGEGVKEPEDRTPTQSRLQRGPGPRFGHFHAILWSNHSPIYMFAYVVCPNLDATAVLSNSQNFATLNGMTVPIVLAQSDFENVRNGRTHSAMAWIFAQSRADCWAPTLRLCPSRRHWQTPTLQWRPSGARAVPHPLCDMVGL
jgi:hypothetical protein